jgi:SAM-dependent methyltransferase
MAPSLKAWRSKAYSAFWEWRLGVDTSARDVSFSERLDYNWYTTIGYREIFAVLRNLDLTSSDVFVDLGCGPGRVICCAAQFEIGEAVGVEVDERLAAIALCNAAGLRRKGCAVRVENQPAETFDFAEGTVFYLFNPFGAATLAKVLDRLRNSLASDPRRARIAYVNPVHEGLLGAAEWLSCYERWERDTKVSYAVSFWRSN